jgi:hypothetical protein
METSDKLRNGIPMVSMIDEAVSFPVTEPQDSAVSLPTTGEQPLPTEVAEDRAAKTEFAGVDPTKARPDFFQDYLQGREAMLRSDAAHRKDVEAAQIQQAVVTDLVMKKGGAVSPVEIYKAFDKFRPADPRDVIERAYADKYMSSLSTARGYLRDNILDDARSALGASYVDTALAAGSDLVTRNQFLTNKMQNAQAVVDKQGWVPYSADFIKGIFQPYNEIKLRGLVGSFLSDAGLGDVLEQQHDNLYAKPYEEFKNIVDTIMSKMEKENPQLAVYWAKSMLGQAQWERRLQNTFTAMMPLDYFGIGKGVAKLIRGSAREVQVMKAARDMVEADARAPTFHPATAAEGVGDTHEAAVRRVSMGQNPMEKAETSLMSTWWNDARKMTSNVGTYLTREAATRLNDTVDTGKSLFDKMRSISRPERAIESVSDPEVNRIRMEQIRQNFKGPQNMIADIDGPIKEEASGTYWFRMRLVDHDASQFADAETAAGRARSIGLADPKIVGQDPDIVYLPKKEVMKREYIDTPANAVDNSAELEKVRKDIFALQNNKELKKLFPEELKEKLAKLKSKEAELTNQPKGKNFRGEPIGSERWVPNPDFHIKTGAIDKATTPMQGGAGTKFFRRDPNVVGGEIEVSPTLRPDIGMIPYNLKTGKFGEEIRIPHAIVDQQGLGFHIEHWVPLKENDDLTRDTLKYTVKGEVRSEAASGGKGLVNSVLGWVRNSDDTLSFNESVQRKAATYSQNNLNKWMQGVSRDLTDIRNGRVRYDEFGAEIPAWRVWATNYLGGKLKGREINEQFTRALNHARQTEKFFENPGELQAFYQQNFKRDPSYLETKAYFGFVKAVEGDRMMMEIAEFRNRAVLGGEQISISLKTKAGELKSEFFDGIPHKSYPTTTDEYIIHFNANSGEEVLRELGKIDSKKVATFNEKVQKGEAQVYEIYDRMHTPLKDFSDIAKVDGNPVIVSYVYVEGAKLEKKALDFNHVVRRGGGHFEWDYDHYLKIADVRAQYATGVRNLTKGVKNIYAGDITIMPIRGRAHGEQVAKIWNEIHDLIKADKMTDAKPLVQKLGIKWEQFTGWYGKGEEGKKAFLDANQKVYVVPRNKTILDLSDDLIKKYRIPNKNDPTKYTDTLVDYTKRGPANNFKVAYNQERNSSFDMKTINDIGSQNNPVYQYQPAEMVDPLETMNRSLRRMVNSTFMDDYKRYHVEHWLREAEPYLKYDNINEVRANPFGWYEKPEWRAGVEKDVIRSLMANQMKGKMLTGTPSKFDTWIHSATNQLADSFYTKYGPSENRGLATKIGTVAPIWMLSKIKEPASFLRSVTFNFKLGLGAVPQFLVQAQTHSVIWSLEPRHGTMGTYGMLLHGWGSFTKEAAVLEGLDNAATKINMFGSKWRKGEWLEARKELDNSGFANVSGEYANLDNQLKQKAVMNDWEKGLQLGQLPFRLGEQSARVTAWYTAFRKFRDANPTKVITNQVRNEILQHADLLTVNMSRASSSMLNAGVFSLSTQFLSYQIKLAELFWGKRLGATPMERNLARARLLTFGAVLYGVPNAIGVTGAPFSDNIREHFMDSLGYVPNEKWLSTFANEGLPAWTMAMITGQLPNFGDRFGSQGFQNIKQALRGDIPWWQVIGGASTTVASNFVSAGLDPYYQYAMSWYRGDSPDERFRIKGSDLVEPLKEISSFSTAAKWITAIETGKWVSKNEATVTDVSPWQATLLSLTGMNPQEQDDMFINNKMIQGEKDAKKRILKEFIKDWRRGMEAMDNNDPDQAHAYKRNAMARLRAVGYAPDEILKAMAIASRTGNAVDSSNYQRFMQGNIDKRDDRREYYRRQLQMKEQQ